MRYCYDIYSSACCSAHLGTTFGTVSILVSLLNSIGRITYTNEGYSIMQFQQEYRLGVVPFPHAPRRVVDCVPPTLGFPVVVVLVLVARLWLTTGIVPCPPPIRDNHCASMTYRADVVEKYARDIATGQ